MPGRSPWRSTRAGKPYGLVSARADDEPDNTNFQDHRFFYIRFDGKKWQVNELAKAGRMPLGWLSRITLAWRR